MSPRLHALAAAVVLTAACGGGAEAPAGTFELPDPAEDATAYVAVVVADPPGDDLAHGAGEHLVIRNNTDTRIDMGGWYFTIEDTRLPLGIGRQIDPDAELRVHPGPGETTDDAVFVGLDEEALPDTGGLLILHDAGGNIVDRCPYGAGR